MSDKGKAQSHSEGKPKLGNIWRWLDKGFLMELSEQMRMPVEELEKYPKDNWKQGVGDEDFIKARLESAQRHLTNLFESKNIKEARDWETNCHEIAACAANLMMVYFCLFNGEGE